MVNRNFTVLRGGFGDSLENKQKHFISAYVTDTRLMGVLAVYAAWSISDTDGTPDPAGDLHQFFYIDCEEAGLETYKGLRGNFGHEAVSVEQSLVGGLGAEKIKLTERELRGILSFWRAFNDNRGLPLPEGYEDYSFVLTPEVIFSDREYFDVMNHICPDITHDYQLVNYFLMRCFGRDYEAAYLLTEACRDGHSECIFPLNLYDNYVKATFCRNVIDVEKRYGDGSVSYLCESLVEMNGEYDSVVSKVVVKDLSVIGFEHCSRFHVSSTEAAMMLGKSEYITLYDVLLSEEEVEDNIGEFTIGFNAIMSRHEKGRMFMSFKPTNSHVNERIFMLSNDVRGVFYLTDSLQLVVSAYSARDICELEKMLTESPLGPYLMENDKYEFREPVLLEFVRSGMEYFDDFVDLITE
ncbi:MAG: hypothetical protein MR991_07870 [Clostridiales bacterium]|nr:hypothetical protein [Clostridiales bacterium]MDD7035319.1 hypothetical protein [Bacillota bacterium]MDY2920574.1 hypothetical protein [Lentihominibacter sp.]